MAYEEYSEDELYAVVNMTRVDYLAAYPHRKLNAWANKRQRMKANGTFDHYRDSEYQPPDMPQPVAQVMQAQPVTPNVTPPIAQTVTLARPRKITRAKPDPAEEELEELLTALEQAEAAREGLSPTQQVIHATAPDNMPTGIAWMSDIHAGASGVDYARFRHDLEVIAKTDGLYTIVNGDLLENAKVMSKAGNALYHAAFANPREQYIYVLKRLRTIRHKIIAILSGNHDSRDAMYAGIDRLPQLCRELDVPYGTEAGMTVYLEVGGHTYTLVTKHDYSGKSNITKTNSARRLYTEWPHSWEAADVVSLAHLHEPNVSTQMQRGREVIWMRSGAYKLVDEYALSKGYKSAYGVPIVVFWPGTRKMVPFMDFDEGVRYLNMVRSEWEEGAA